MTQSIQLLSRLPQATKSPDGPLSLMPPPEVAAGNC